MKAPEKMVQDAIFRWLVMHRHLAIRVNSGAMVFEDGGDSTPPSPPYKGGSRKRRFVRFAMWQVVGKALEWAGISDILACCDGQFVAIEVKAPGKKGKVSENQAAFLQAVRRCGGLAIVAEGIDDVEQVVGSRQYETEDI